MQFSQSLGWVASCALIAACGGCGGGGSGGSATAPQLSFTPAAIQLTQTLGYEETVQVRASINPQPAGGQFYAFIVADKPVVQAGQAAFAANADNSVTVTLLTDASLAAGKYTGELTVRVCRDASCRDEVALTGNRLPYAIEVLPRTQVTVTGATAGGLGAQNEYSVDPGTTVVLTSNLPVTWSKGSSISSADIVPASSTSTRWEGQITGRSGEFVGISANAIGTNKNTIQVLFNIR